MEKDDYFNFYLAGLIDGEGTFTININRNKNIFYPSLRINISNTSKELLEKIQKKIDIGRIYPDRRIKVNWSMCFGLWISNLKEIKQMIVILDRKLILKQKELDLLKKAVEIIENKRKERGISKSNFTKEEIIKLAELRDLMKRRKGAKYRNKEYFEKQFSI